MDETMPMPLTTTRLMEIFLSCLSSPFTGEVSREQSLA
jgi:hypothetical protein